MKKNAFTHKIIPGLMLIVLITGLASCDRTRHEKGYEYFPDMAHSRAWETYSEHPELSKGMSMMLPAEGSVPRGFVPYPYEAGAEGRELAGKNLGNPVAKNEPSIKRGAEQYAIFCTSCHGEKGDGNGFLYSSGLYPYKPSDLINDKMRSAGDGEIFHVITKGWGLMGSHAAQISPEDRWKIILFIRHSLQTVPITN
jgi:mono/diheme cytochrome c family protein